MLNKNKRSPEELAKELEEKRVAKVTIKATKKAEPFMKAGSEHVVGTALAETLVAQERATIVK